MATQSAAFCQDLPGRSVVLERLEAALGEEWRAYYQYWTAAHTIVASGCARLRDCLMTHAADELSHALLLCGRIMALRGTPVLTPGRRHEAQAPVRTRSDAEAVLKIIRTAEECAMIRYQEIADLTEGTDEATCSLAKTLLACEQRHEQDMQDSLDAIAPPKRFQHC